MTSTTTIPALLNDDICLRMSELISDPGSDAGDVHHQAHLAASELFARALDVLGELVGLAGQLGCEGGEACITEFFSGRDEDPSLMCDVLLLCIVIQVCESSGTSEVRWRKGLYRLNIGYPLTQHRPQMRCVLSWCSLPLREQLSACVIQLRRAEESHSLPHADLLDLLCDQLSRELCSVVSTDVA